VSAAADRPVWLPGAKAPPHLNGSLPGDRGFDPLSLGTDAGRLKWYAEAERQNARWAMIAVAGILGQEVLGVTPKWFAAGAKDYGVPVLGLLAIQQVLFGMIETTRFAAYKSGQKNALFPLDPAGMNSETNAVKEIKNGRLAMVAFVGFAVQAILTREGPIEGLVAHLSNPFGHNIVTNIANIPNVIGGSS
jgi:light-harvesting complex I chlorophyll a/b binding protein 5